MTTSHVLASLLILMATQTVCKHQPEWCTVGATEKCQVLVEQMVTWERAEDICHTHGGNLIKINHPKPPPGAEMEDAWRPDKKFLHHNMWIGGLVSVQGWRWASGEYVRNQGCYQDDKSSPALPHLETTSPIITAQACLNRCDDHGYTYAGLQPVAFNMISKYTIECRCGNEGDYNKYGMTTGCDVQCPVVPSGEEGSGTEETKHNRSYCGKMPNKMNIYRTGGLEYDAWQEPWVDSVSDSHLCVTMTWQIDAFSWQPTKCYNKHGFICQYVPSSNCFETYMTNSSGKCLSYNTSQVDWYTAKSICEKLGGKLVTAHNEDDYSAIEDVILTLQGDTWWIGLSRWRWTWSTGEDIQKFYNWGVSQPTEDATRECLSTQGVGGPWQNIRCDEKLPFICIFKRGLDEETAISLGYNITGDEEGHSHETNEEDDATQQKNTLVIGIVLGIVATIILALVVAIAVFICCKFRGRQDLRKEIIPMKSIKLSDAKGEQNSGFNEKKERRDSGIYEEIPDITPYETLGERELGDGTEHPEFELCEPNAGYSTLEGSVYQNNGGILTEVEVPSRNNDHSHNAPKSHIDNREVDGIAIQEYSAELIEKSIKRDVKQALVECQGETYIEQLYVDDEIHCGPPVITVTADIHSVLTIDAADLATESSTDAIITNVTAGDLSADNVITNVTASDLSADNVITNVTAGDLSADNVITNVTAGDLSADDVITNVTAGDLSVDETTADVLQGQNNLCLTSASDVYIEVVE